MNLFSSLARYLSLRKSIKGIFVPYLNRLKVDCSTCELIGEIPDQCVSIRGQLNPKRKKHQKLIAEYDSLAEAIRSHNATVKSILQVAKEFSFDRIIADPLNLKPTDLKRFEEAGRKVKSFDVAPLELSQFADEAIEAYSELEVIQKQWTLKEEIAHHLDLASFGYIDLPTKRSLLDYVANSHRELGRWSKHYYDFSLLDSFSKKIDDKNQRVISLAIQDPLFDDINGRSLDKEQRTAVVRDDIAALTIAGAGSGKTLTICGKLKWLLERKGIDPTDILLLSYSKKSATDLEEKALKISPNLVAATFHKTGLEILKSITNKPFVVEEQFDAIIEEFFQNEVFANKDLRDLVFRYIALYGNDDTFDKQYEEKGDLYEDLRKENYTTLKDLLTNIGEDRSLKKTLKKEYVKSYEELAIANFYFMNGIEYEYEKPFYKEVSDPDHRQYTPDFYLKDYDIYHEHYGVDRKGRCKQYSKREEQRYVAGMAWKRELHAEENTNYIETYSFQFSEDIWDDELTKKLKSFGVVFHPISDERLNEALTSIYEGQDFKSFINLVKTFVSLYKARYRDEKSFDDLLSSRFASRYQKKRATLFLGICKKAYLFYMKRIRDEGKIDFDDMILLATEKLKETEGFSYKYIIVDEFQDISYSRMVFLKALIERGHSRLFAVGDDWQAIYRFSGCDLSIFLQFGQYFGEHVINKITSTHRNSQELQDIAGPFVRKNPEQIDKIISSKKRLPLPIKVMFYKESKSSSFLSILRAISEKDPCAKVLILGRNNKDYKDVLSQHCGIDSKASQEGFVVLKSPLFPDMTLRFSTVHGSKGLEEDYVVLINAEDAKNGFPNKTEDDVLLNLVLADQSPFEFAEERRLWYVALTRTRSFVYILADASRQSVFLKEILESCDVLNEDELSTKKHVHCPDCGSGRLILREGNGKQFYGCSNYPYCNYKINDLTAVEKNRRCPNCGDFLVVRKGRHGLFYGCHSFPKCKFTQEIYSDLEEETADMVAHANRGWIK